MPLIDAKVTMKVTDGQKEEIKSAFGKLISTLNKPESYLMVGFEDEYCLYFAGEKLEKGAFISVDIFGSPNSSAFDRMTERICEIYQEELDIPGNHIYVEYRATKDWGWNGRNF